MDLDLSSIPSMTGITLGESDSSLPATLTSGSGATSRLAKPLHLQRLERALRIDHLLRQVESFLDDPADEPLLVPLHKGQIRTLKTRAYNLSKVTKSKKWLKSVLLDKSDSDSDFGDDFSNYQNEDEEDESIEDMIRYANMRKHVKKGMLGVEDDLFGELKVQSNPYKSYSASIISSSSVSKPPNSPSKTATLTDGKAKKPRKTNSKTPSRKKVSSSSAVLPPIAASTSTTLTNAGIQRSHSLDSAPATLPDSISITPIPILGSIGASSLPSSSASSISVSVCEDPIKRFKADKLLDEIPYDMTLPDEILQSESSNEADGPPSCTRSLNDEVVYTNKLPVDIFDTESNNSLLSQCMSSPPSIVHPTPILPSSVKSATAPSTPTGLSKSHSKLSFNSKNRWKPIRKPAPLPPVSISLQTSASTPATPTSVSSSIAGTCSISHDTIIRARRKGLWLSITKNDIPRKHSAIMRLHLSKVSQCKILAEACKELQDRVPKDEAHPMA